MGYTDNQNKLMKGNNMEYAVMLKLFRSGLALSRGKWYEARRFKNKTKAELYRSKFPKESSRVIEVEVV